MSDKILPNLPTVLQGQTEEVINRFLVIRKNTANKSLSDQTLLHRAKDWVKEHSVPDTDIDIASKFKNQVERRMAKSLLDKYLRDYLIETISDKNILQEIIYLEIIQLRLQEKMNEVYESEAKALPLNILTTIHENSEAILKLKGSLGLNKSKDKANAYDVLDHLKKRFKIWREENQASRTLKCPHCSKFVFLKMRTEAWEAQKHPFFKDNMVYNKALFSKFGQTITIDREFVASILETSPDYVDWVITKAKQQDQQELILKETLNGSEETEKRQEKVTVEPVIEVQVETTIESKDANEDQTTEDTVS